MLLIGQYDSPFVRRVGIAMTLYGIAFDHAPWSGFGDVDKIARHNPLRRVPALVLDDNSVLTDSFVILEAIDDMVGPDRAFLGRAGADRIAMLRLCAFAAGVADKGVSLVYERAFREGLPMWVERCQSQVRDTLALLDAERAARTSEWLFGDQLSHADIVLATMLRFISEALPGMFAMSGLAALRRHSEACEALPVFQSICQPYQLTMPGEQ
ncbi:Glutathione S-transferase [Sphingomonas sp. YR710]|uniref:glutathione S-transferase family protein n=1 Tax=Sphingomonas sp. YR710 TaxID=1882773 RepID=UPI000890B6F1|nr:glutathione S-transferase family protein [Sphingomonas sp. YR710]SDC65453.1 Glutathione S-transferase [Sphingomonas sp. YR710]